MATIKCKYCDANFGGGSGYCPSTPNKKHVGVSDGKTCVYCASNFHASGYCNHSPSKKHQLND
jgi:hypothetical protein